VNRLGFDAPSPVAGVRPKVREAREAILGRFEKAPDAVLVRDLRAVWTLASITNPSVSTSRWRFLPRTFFPPSYPLCSPPTPVVLADWESVMPALGSGSLPERATRSRAVRR
jgi:hypothetical protein